MSRPWQIWLFFTLCLLAVVPAMLWVTSKALELDWAEYAGRRQAEQEEYVSRALWMIDARLGPLLAEEAARPDFVFRPLGNSRSLANLENGNYLATAPSYVLLHFELHPHGAATSPQIADHQSQASSWEADASLTTQYERRLTELLATVQFEELRERLPAQTLPQLTLLANNGFSNSEFLPQVVLNSSETALAATEEESPPNGSGMIPQIAQRAFPQQTANLPTQGENLYGDYEANSPGYNNRKGKELLQRNNAYNSLATRRIVDQRQQGNLDPLNTTAEEEAPPETEATVAESPVSNARKPITIREGISGPVWIADKLLFARRVQRGEEAVVQGCWLDWETLRHELLDEVSDLLPQADLVPIGEGEEPRLGRLLATLPHMQLVVPPPDLAPPLWSPIRLALAAAWGCLVLAALASCWLLLGVISLSERRAAFVSAVTHELRTPLTTFRMYAEMLAADMITAPEQKQKYLETLCVEADRLTHLVDNVLLYARLERSRTPGKNRVALSVGEMLEHYASRLKNRTEQADMQWELQCDDATAETLLTTDPSAVEQIVFNLVDNAAKYGATVSVAENKIILTAQKTDSWLELSIRDFGPGLSSLARRQLFQPFSKTSEEAAVTAPGVGLGLALCKRLAAALGGRLELAAVNPGTKFVLKLPLVT